MKLSKKQRTEAFTTYARKIGVSVSLVRNMTCAKYKAIAAYKLKHGLL